MNEVIIVIGLLFLFLSMHWSFKIRAIIDKKRFGTIWFLATSLIVLFIISYVLMLIFDASQKEHSLIYDAILLISPLFVNLIMYAGYLTARDLSQSNISQRHLSKILNALQIGLVVCDDKHRIEIVNDYVADFLGYKTAELLNTQANYLFHDHADRDEILNQKIEINNEEILLTKSDSIPVPAQFSSYPIKNKKGRIVAYIFQVQDVFRKKFEKAQEELNKASQELKDAQVELKKLSMVASSTSNAVIITDANGMTEWVNDGFCDMTGYMPHEIIGKKPGRVLQGEETDQDIVADIGKQLRCKKEVDVEIVNYNKRGEKYWLRMVINPIFNDDYELTHFISIETDITEAKKNERDLKLAKERALESKRTKEEFLANMSHEIRTPLNGIKGFTDLLLQDKVSGKQEKYLNAIKDSSDNLLVIINDILDFSKIEAGKIEFEEISFSIHDLISKLFKIFEFKAEERGVSLKKTIDPAIPKMLIGDPVRINQIFTNLINNAIKFTQNGIVSVDLQMEKREEDLVIKVVVADTGIGIPKDKLDHIFDVFTQASSNTTRKFGGTGLGLAIVKKLIKMYGGDIVPESTVNEGTKFKFSLDLKESLQEENEEKVTVSNVKNLENIKVLVAEDFKMNQLLIKAFLDEWSATTQIVENGKLAVEAVEEGDHDIILMDVNMPEMDGLEATRLIRQLDDQEKNKIPIIGLTASAINGDKEKGIENGMNDYVTKPFDQDVLYCTMVRLIENIKGIKSQEQICNKSDNEVSMKDSSIMRKAS